MKKLIVTGLCAALMSSSVAQNCIKQNLRFIGMPVGGICTGQVYLGGDGQLWNWDIFNIAASRPGGPGDRYYLNPMHQEQKFVNGFGIHVKEGAKEYNRLLNSTGFSNITFTGEYPIGKIKYLDQQVPVEVKLQAFSPFIPTDADNSGLPVTVMEYEVKNLSDGDLYVELNGWLQNMSCYQTSEKATGKHANKVVKDGQYTSVVLTSDTSLSSTHADWGSMSLALLDKDGLASANCPEELGTGFFGIDAKHTEATAELGQRLVGGVKKGVQLKKGESHTFTYVVAWHFPNVHLWDAGHNWKGKENLRHYYSGKFADASSVVRYVAEHPALIADTKLWNRTWYDSSLPKDFLDRTFANVSTLATSATVRFDDLKNTAYNEGRYYNFEGVYLGEGTCRHVSHYGQVLGRVFPALARQHRQQIDLGLSLTDEGVIQYRGEFSGMGQHDGRGYAADGQAGTILGVYREYLMSPDDSFLKNNWRKVKLAMQYMIKHDKEKSGKADGILEGVQYNTLDRMWYGKISWISGLYIAALQATAEMAQVVGDRSFAKECRTIAKRGSAYISEHLFNGEYFIQELDPEHLEAPNTNKGCHLDQLLGQYWASQLGLGYVFPKNQVQTALQSIMKYNYKENYDEYLKHAAIPVSRWYADGNEKGLIGCTFPHGGDNQAPGKIKSDWEKLVVGYFSEMWTGQEHAVAANLLSEGMVDDALKVEAAINDRYSPSKRNPYNEIEYGNHYTRAMSGYAPFISASGFYYNGPEGILSFNPVVQPNKYKSAFITSEGWGSYEQKLDDAAFYRLQLHYGVLSLTELILPARLQKTENLEVVLNDKPIKVKTSCKQDKLHVLLKKLELKRGDELVVRLSD